MIFKNHCVLVLWTKNSLSNGRVKIFKFVSNYVVMNWLILVFDQSAFDVSAFLLLSKMAEYRVSNKIRHYYYN